VKACSVNSHTISVVLALVAVSGEFYTTDNRCRGRRLLSSLSKSSKTNHVCLLLLVQKAVAHGRFTYLLWIVHRQFSEQKSEDAYLCLQRRSVKN